MISNRRQIHTAVKIFILFVLLLSLITPASVVFADDATPPDDVQEEMVSDDVDTGETETDMLSEEEASEDELSVDATEAETDSSLADEIPDESAETDEPVNIPPVDSVVEESAESDVEIPLVGQLPGGTDVVIVDSEDGQIVPLATQEAAEAITHNDPMWCPEGVNPIANTDGCTDSYSNLSGLLSALSGENQPSQNGTIWIEKTYDSSTAEPAGTTNITINGNVYSTWRDYSLTVQGGWDGPGTTTIDANSPSLFSGDRLRIINWQNDVTVKNIVVDDVSEGASLEIEIDLPDVPDPETNPTYTVSIEDVDVNRNTTNHGVIVDNDESPGSVTVKNSDFTDNNKDGLNVLARGNVTLLNIVSTGNGDEGVQINNTASAANASVQIDGTNLFSDNDAIGLYIRSDGTITVNNVTADGNGTSGAWLDTGGDEANANSAVAVTGTNSFSGNLSSGLYITSKGDVTLNDITADNNDTSYGVRIDNCRWSINACLGSGNVTITGNNSFSSNGDGSGDDGLVIASQGDVTLENITASNNEGRGVSIDNRFSGSAATVTMNGVNNISNNAGDGLAAYSGGTIKLNEVTADGNGTTTAGSGAHLENVSGNGDVIITGYHNSFSNNSNLGLDIYTEGNIELYFATITGNNIFPGSLNGALFRSPGVNSQSAKIYCSTFGNNNGYGLNAWNFENTLTFVGQNNFFGNSSGDYSFNGTALFETPDYLCEEPILGCTDPNAYNYDPNANTDDSSCIPVILGCMDPNALNYDPDANTDDGSCEVVILGCMDPAAFNYNPSANLDDDSCEPVIYGCTDPTHPDFDPLANTNSGCAVQDDSKKAKAATLVTGSQFVAISCDNPSMDLRMLNGNYVTFANLCGYEAYLTAATEANLPGKLPDDVQYVSGLNVSLVQDGNVIDSLPIGTGMTVSFKVPAGMEGKTFTILRWDGSNWVEENTSIENDYVTAGSSHTGMFVLVIS